MERNLMRATAAELIGTFIFVFFAAGSVCVNQMTTPQNQQPEAAFLNAHQPGLVGVALAQGLMLAVLLTIISPFAGGLNPAITIMLWVFNRIETKRGLWYLAAQFLGAILAGLCIRCTFDVDVLRGAHMGAPHLNPIVYPVIHRGVLLAGTGIEVILTFSLVLAIFSIIPEGPRPGGWGAGAVLTAAVLVGFPLTGAALNPARWFGSVVWELSVAESTSGPGPTADVFVYVAGPVVGALLAGLVSFKLFAVQERATGPAPAAPVKAKR